MNPLVEAISNPEILGLSCKYQIVGEAAPLLILVHGRGGNFDVMWTFKRTFPSQCSVVAVQAPLVDPVIGGFSWWNVDDQPELRRVKLSAAQQLLDDFISRFERRFSLTPSRRVAAGFSQGAGLLSIMAQVRPGLFSGLALLAGFVIEERSREASVLKLPKIFMAHGTKDEIIPLAMAHTGRDRLKQLGFEVEYVEEDVGHKLGVQSQRALATWLSEIVS